MNNFYLAQLRNQYHGAGRTDTGVHAKEMYAHFDFEAPFESIKLNSFTTKIL
jgi:tRNA U38,U39,U40 pseudouridine synthase TruA